MFPNGSTKLPKINFPVLEPHAPCPIGMFKKYKAYKGKVYMNKGDEYIDLRLQ